MVLEVRANTTEILRDVDTQWYLVQVGAPNVMYTVMPFRIMWQQKLPIR